MYKRYKQLHVSASNMASADVKDDWVLDVPREWMTKFNGFSCDCGGSVMKVVYRHKEDWKELENSKRGRLRFISVGRPQRSAAIKYLRENCYFQHDIEDKENPVMLFTSGVGSHQFSTELNSAFAIKAESISEFDCFVKAFVYLSQEVKVSELVYPDCTKAEGEIKELKAQFAAMFNPADYEDLSSATWNFQKTEDKAEVARPEKFDMDSMFPCILAMFGSGVGFITVKKDGSFSVPDILNRGGRYFCAVGGLMTGATTYDELVALAAKGDPNKVHYTEADVAKEAQDHSESQDDAAGMYSMGQDTTVDNYLYTMGKAMGKTRDDFSREDIAACWLNTFCADICQCLLTTCSKEEVKNVFWCGSFIKSEVVRHNLTLEWRRRGMNVGFMTGEESESNLYFLKLGPYLGALGCVINSVDQFLKPPSQVAAEKKEKEEKEKQTNSGEEKTQM